MEIVFFVARPEQATRVASSDDLPGDIATDPMTADGPGGLLALGAALGVANGAAVKQLRDATCQSFPVWALSRPLCTVLESLGDDQIDSFAEAWQPHPDSDLYERATCLLDLRHALRTREDGERLFALLEERAF